MLWWLLVPFAALLGYALGAYRLHQLQNTGEALVRSALASQLPPPDWHLLNNVTLALPDGTTQVDHVLVSRFGIFVIETKHYKGWIFGDERAKNWTQVIFKRKHRFQNPLRQNFRHVLAVQNTLDFLEPDHVTGLVVFTGDAEFKSRRPAGVYPLDTLVAKLKSYEAPVISENRMHFCVGRLECRRLALTRQTDVEHLASLHRRHLKNAP